MFRGKAPLRISFAGGGTDIPPYPQQHGGVVLSATIDKYAYATLVPRRDTELHVRSHDYNVSVQYDISDLTYDGQLDIVKSVVRNMGIEGGAELSLHCDAPPGSGLASSSAMAVALIGVFKHWQRLPMTEYEIAQLAYYVEREDLGQPGGIQDQYATTFGGFNFIEFFDSTVLVNQLKVKPEILNELQYRLLLCYTGQTRPPAGFEPIMHEQLARMESGQSNQALDALKTVTLEMKRALLQGELDLFGDLLHWAWTNKKRLAHQISNTRLDEMYDVAREYGARGGKVMGAGGGGYLLLYCDGDKKHIVADHIEQLGGIAVGFAFEDGGLQTWTA